MKAGTLRRGPLNFKWIRFYRPLMRTSSTLLKLERKRCSFSLFQVRTMKSSSCQVHSLNEENSPSVAATNVRSIEYGHVLRIPRILECLPQRIDRESFLLALYMAGEAGNPYFRLGYDSLGAFATINHLHFQAYYLAVPFSIERSPSKKICSTTAGVMISELLNYPVRGLLFEGGTTVEYLFDVVSDSCICLQENNIPYNVLISDSGRRVFLLPQCYAEKQALGEVSSELLETQVNPAFWEISGHMVLKRKKDYEEATEENAFGLLAEVSLSEERFHEVKAIIFEVIDSQIDEVGSANPDKPKRVDTISQSIENADAINTGIQPTMVSV